jgi:hypothetical protein
MADARNTIQTGLRKNDKNYKKFSYFTAGIDVTQQNLDSFDPYIRGRGRIFMHTPPKFMMKQFPDLTRNFKSYIETGYKSVTGIGNMSVDFETFEGGFNGQKFENVSKVTDETDTMTITVYEQSGSPVREFMETWVTGVRDPRSGIAHYHGAIQNANTAYGEKYHTAEFIYYVLDPTAKQIEYACMFAHAFPKNIDKDHYNYESGNNGNVELTLDFSVTKYESNYINQIAQWYMFADAMDWNYLNFNPNASVTKKGEQVSIWYDLDLDNARAPYKANDNWKAWDAQSLRRRVGSDAGLANADSIPTTGKSSAYPPTGTTTVDKNTGKITYDY